MLNIAINCPNDNPETLQFITNIIEKYSISVSCLKENLKHKLSESGKKNINSFNPAEKYDFVLSIGGDGTFLETAYAIYEYNIPILGINFGRLGFLADIQTSDNEILEDIFVKKEWDIETRSLIEVISPQNIMGKKNIALNECAIYKKESQSLLTLHTYINNKYLSSFWSDGLLIATPTGSTAYSLSIGGPILSPNSKNFIINPIAPHHLTVRPVVIEDNKELKIIVEGRDDYYNLSLDSRCVQIKDQTEIILKKSKHKIFLIKHKNDNFFKTLRKKLMWGVDIRN